MLNTDAVYSDPDCREILVNLSQSHGFKTAEIALWVRLTAWSYFTTEKQKEGLDYAVDVVDPDSRLKAFILFYRKGLVGFSVDEEFVVYRPANVIQYWKQLIQDDAAAVGLAVKTGRQVSVPQAAEVAA